MQLIDPSLDAQHGMNAASVGARSSEPKVVADKAVSSPSHSDASMHQPAAVAEAQAQVHETHQASDSNSNATVIVGFSLVVALLSAAIAGLALAKTMGLNGRNHPRHMRVQVEPDPSEVELQGVKPLLVQRAEYELPISASVASVVVGQVLPAHCVSEDEALSAALGTTRGEEPPSLIAADRDQELAQQ